MQPYTFWPHHHFHDISFLSIVALIVIFFLAIAALSRLGRGQRDRPSQVVRNDPLPGSSPVGLCQRCRSPLPVDAAYCGRCGMAVTRTAPIPMPRRRTAPLRQPQGSPSRWLAYAIIVLLGLLGLGAFWFMSDSEPLPAPPVQRHAPGDAW